MWVARIKLDGRESLLGKRCVKFGVEISGYPISVYTNEKGLFIYGAWFMFGVKEDVHSFVKDLKEDDRVLNVENQNNFIISQIFEESKHKLAYKQSIVHLEPIRIKRDGSEFWTMASWDKKDLTDFLDIVESSHMGELLSIKKEKIKNFSILSMNPELTENQTKALELATSNGYYDYPRKINLDELSKLSGLSYTTFHEHLRKAEKKMLPFAVNKIRSIS
jgi:predicted DNA binding protein